MGRSQQKTAVCGAEHGTVVQREAEANDHMGPGWEGGDGTCRGELDPHPSTEGAKRSMGVGVCLKTNTKHSKTRGIQHT